MPSVVRVFFALDLAEDIKESIVKYTSELKKRSKKNSIRWTRIENLHITLQFLAEVHIDHLPALLENVRAKLVGWSIKSPVSLNALHLFPNPYRPRVIVLDITPQDELAALAKKIGEGIQATSYPVEDRPFRGHLTLGRIKQPKGLDLGFLTEGALPAFGEVEVKEVVLFRSEPGPEGSMYSVLERIPVMGL